MATLNAQTVSYVGLRDDIFEGAWTEDGDRRIETAFSIFVETVNGRRFFLNDSGMASNEYDHDHIMKVQDKRIEKIEKALKDGRTLNLAYWTEGDPAYGSSAYDRMDRNGEFKAREYKDFLFTGR